MEGDKGGRTVGNENAMPLHVNVDLTKFYILGKLVVALIGFILVHFFDFFLLVGKFDLATFKIDLELADKVVIELALMNLAILDFVLLLLLLEYV